VKNFVRYSLPRLGLNYIDVYRPARLDPAVPIEEMVGAIAELIKAGYVRYIGLSEMGVNTIRRAAQVHPIADPQIEYSLISPGIEEVILPACRELGVGITAYAVLSRGLISGHWHEERRGPTDHRRLSPRFQDGNVEKKMALVEASRAVAQDMGRPLQK
jgi:aryl-alcohol dehydrogenase-like predicted oxidoreductase